MNLENLNLVELNAQEALFTEGGHWLVKALEAIAIVATGALMYHEKHCGKCNGTGWSTGALSQGAGGSW